MPNLRSASLIPLLPSSALCMFVFWELVSVCLVLRRSDCYSRSTNGFKHTSCHTFKARRTHLFRLSTHILGLKYKITSGLHLPPSFPQLLDEPASSYAFPAPFPKNAYNVHEHICRTQHLSPVIHCSPPTAQTCRAPISHACITQSPCLMLCIIVH